MVILALIMIAGIFTFSNEILAKNNYNGGKKVDKYILERRFGEFSTSGSLVLVKVKNTKTQEQMEIVCDNTEWMFVCQDDLKLVSKSKEYTEYMIKNYRQIFELAPETYAKLKVYKTGDSYKSESPKGWEEIKKEFFEPEKMYFVLKDKTLAKNRDFLRMLLEQNVVVRNTSYDGSLYVQE